MRSAARFKEHPVHPILVGFPVAYLAGSALAALWARVANRASWFRTATHMSGLNGAEIDVAGAEQLGIDQMTRLRGGGKRIVLARVERGYVAFDDRCTHKGGSLADGVLVCGTVQCPWHGSQFDVDSGAVKQG